MNSLKSPLLHESRYRFNAYGPLSYIVNENICEKVDRAIWYPLDESVRINILRILCHEFKKQTFGEDDIWYDMMTLNT